MYMMWLFFLFVVSSAFGKNVSSSGRAPLVKLIDGNEMPRFGLGTWLGILQTGTVGDVQKAVEVAIDAGYRHIDTAHIYNTEEQVGLAVNNKINERVVKREDMFITTKLWNDAHPRDSVLPALKDSLSKLGLDYVDLYLIHWPISSNDTDYLETWDGLIDAQKQNLTKSIGVSNFNEKQLQRLIENSGVTPAVLQVEINLNLQQPSLLEFCKTNKIAVVGYTPFGSIFPQKATSKAPPPRVDDEDLVNIAKKYNKTVPQVVLRYLFELGVTPIPKSVTKERVEQNFDIFDFELTQEERDLFKNYEKNFRTIDFAFWKKSLYYPF